MINEINHEFVSQKLTINEKIREEKNVRRRVYDALNVLISANIILRAMNKKIKWNNINNPLKYVDNDDNENINKNDNLNNIKNMVSDKEKLIEEKISELRELLYYYIAIKNLVRRNSNEFFKNDNREERINFPFIVVQIPHENFRLIPCKNISNYTVET